MADFLAMQLAVKLPPHATGAKGDEIVGCCKDLAVEAIGALADAEQTGLLSFAYLWRRFGPSCWGSDDHKDLVGYILTTPDPDVFLTVHPSGSPLSYAFGYLATPKLREEHDRPLVSWERKFERWFVRQNKAAVGLAKTAADKKELAALYWKWRCDKGKVAAASKAIGKYPRHGGRSLGPIARRVKRALVAAMRELLRPVYVRDVPINVFGVMTDDDAAKWKVRATKSPEAGYGVRSMRRKGE